MPAADPDPVPVVVDRNHLIPMPDGVKLAADCYRPDEPGRWPAILTFIPYHKDGRGGRLDVEAVNRYFAGRGYAALTVDFRGLGSSGGVNRFPFDPQEARDGHEDGTKEEHQQLDPLTRLHTRHRYLASVAARRPDAARMSSTTEVRIERPVTTTELTVTTVTTTYQVSVTAAITVDGGPFWKWNGVRLCNLRSKPPLTSPPSSSAELHTATPDPEGG